MTSDTNTLDDSDYQAQLNQAVLAVFEESGAGNHLRAQFTKNVAKIAIDPENPNLIPLQPRIKAMDSVAWSRCLCFVVAYLRRYKMQQTLLAMKNECPILPKNTGFQHASDLEIFFNSLKKTAIVIADQTFDEKVIDYRAQLDKEAKKEGLLHQSQTKRAKRKRIQN